MKICRSCRAEMPLSEFYRNVGTRDGLQSDCRGCIIRRKKAAYAARKAGLVPTISVASQVCGDCHVEKAVADFGVNHYRPNGLKLYCRACVRVRWWRQRYGLSPEEHGAMVAAQAGCCAICGEPSDLVIDHDHETGAVRGLICDACNVGLGRFGDSLDRLIAAAAYLLASRDVLTRVGE